MRLWYWLVEIPAALVSGWLWLYRGLLLIIVIATFTATLVGLAAWAWQAWIG